MENKLQTLVTKIQTSPKLKADEKEYFYKVLHSAISGLVWPVLVRYMDQAELKRLAENPQEVTPENYQSLVEAALVDGKALVEIDQMIERILAKTEDFLESHL